MLRALPLIVLAVACEPPPTDDSTPPDTESCETAIESTWPEQGATDAYWLDSIEFVLDEPDASATIVTDIAGQQTVSDDGLSITYQPDEPLTPDTAYEVDLDYCRGTASIGFTTSSYGQPVDDPAALLGQTWSYDLRDARFYQAGYLGELLQTFAERVGLVSVVGVSGGTVDLRLAVADDNDPPGQDYCARTIDVPGVDFTAAPFLAFGPTAIEFNAYLGTIVLHEMMVETTVAPDGGSLGGMVLEAVIDVRSVAEAVDMELTELCDLLEVYGAPCSACPEDGEPYCASTAADRLEAPGVSVTLEPIAEAYADPRCEEEPTQEP